MIHSDKNLGVSQVSLYQLFFATFSMNSLISIKPLSLFSIKGLLNSFKVRFKSAFSICSKSIFFKHSFNSFLVFCNISAMWSFTKSFNSLTVIASILCKTRSFMLGKRVSANFLSKTGPIS